MKLLPSRSFLLALLLLALVGCGSRGGGGGGSGSGGGGVDLGDDDAAGDDDSAGDDDDSADSGAQIVVESDDPLSPHLVSFGNVDAGDVAVEQVTIRNLGPKTLEVAGLEISGAFEITNSVVLPLQLAPDELSLVSLSSSPLMDEHAEGTLTVTSSDPVTPSVVVQLEGEGIAPAIQVDPPSFDFGNPPLGCSAQLEVMISNIGRASLEIATGGIWYEDLGGNGEMVLVHSIADGTVLETGESVQAQVLYTPTNVEPDTGVLHVQTNDPGTPDATSTQFGIAHLYGDNMDLYEQELNNDTFLLTQAPVESSIEVSLNSVPIFVGWTYASALQSIVFDVDHVPEDEDEIKIEYALLGDCD